MCGQINVWILSTIAPSLKYLKISSDKIISKSINCSVDDSNMQQSELRHIKMLVFFPLPGPAAVFIGSDPDGERRYSGLLQDVRLYRTALSRSQIHELHAQPPKTDLRTISGYLRYLQDERRKSFVVEVRDDDVEEGEEIFHLQLVAARGGARLPFPRPTATLRVMKSDNANGLFGFTGTCIPDVSAHFRG